MQENKFFLVNSDLIGYCYHCNSFQSFYHDLKGDSWGDTCKNCNGFTPLSEFSRLIPSDSSYIPPKAVLFRELLIKMILVFEKIGRNSDNCIRDAVYDLFKFLSIVIVISTLSASVSVQMQVLRDFQLYQQFHSDK